MQCPLVAKHKSNLKKFVWLLCLGQLKGCCFFWHWLNTFQRHMCPCNVYALYVKVMCFHGGKWKTPALQRTKCIICIDKSIHRRWTIKEASCFKMFGHSFLKVRGLTGRWSLLQLVPTGPEEHPNQFLHFRVKWWETECFKAREMREWESCSKHADQ